MDIFKDHQNRLPRGQAIELSLPELAAGLVIPIVGVPSLEAWEKMDSSAGMKKADLKKMETIMKGYHALVEHGRREIYKIEG